MFEPIDAEGRALVPYGGRTSVRPNIWGDGKKMYRMKRRPTLMPLVALGALSLAVTLPALSSTVHAAPPVAYATVTVHRGDTLWSLAENRTPVSGDVQATVDQITATNHLSTAALHLGQKLRVP